MITEREIYEWARRALREWGVDNSHCTMVLFSMIYADIGYADAERIYAEYRNIAREPMRAALCYALLAARVEVRPESIFEYLKWRYTDENGISAGKGS